MAKMILFKKIDVTISFIYYSASNIPDSQGESLNGDSSFPNKGIDSFRLRFSQVIRRCRASILGVRM
jgi:hypothetical protein